MLYFVSIFSYLVCLNITLISYQPSVTYISCGILFSTTRNLQHIITFLFFFKYNTFVMAALHLVSGFIAVSCTTAWSFGDTVNVNLETKYDNNHNKLKQLLTEHKTFQPHNWTHYAFLIQGVTKL